MGIVAVINKTHNERSGSDITAFSEQHDLFYHISIVCMYFKCHHLSKMSIKTIGAN